jgi:Zn-dependent peptidase ImmA (M78 family)
MNRDYRKADEEEAYAVGAAALVPYASLKRMLLQGNTAREISLHFRVSRELVEYRMKVTHLWREFKENNQ